MERRGCAGSSAARQQQGREGQGPCPESQGPELPSPPLVPSGPASICGQDPGREGAEAAAGVGAGFSLSLPAPPSFPGIFILPPPAGHLSAVTWDKGGGGGWSAASWAMGTERAASEKRQQLRGRSRALLIQAVEGAVILC